MNKKKSDTNEEASKFKRISVLCGAIGIIISIGALVSSLAANSWGGRCVYTGNYVERAGTLVSECVYENGEDKISDVFSILSAIFSVMALIAPAIGFAFGIISMVRKEQYGWNIVLYDVDEKRFS